MEQTIENPFTKIYHPNQNAEQSRLYFGHVKEANLLKQFTQLNQDDIIRLYCENHDNTDPKQIKDFLNYKPEVFLWSGIDFMKVKHKNKDTVAIIELNSPPSGSCFYPAIDSTHDADLKLMEAFAENIANINKEDGVLAILFQNFPMEKEILAIHLSNITNEEVYLVNLRQREVDQNYCISNEYIEIFDGKSWLNIRAAFLIIPDDIYLCLPFQTKTFLSNSALSFIAGGINKNTAASAFNKMNQDLPDYLQIKYPFTTNNLTKEECINLTNERDGIGVAKGAYGYGGKEVFFLLSEENKKEFIDSNVASKSFVYQDLIGFPHWFSFERDERVYQIGTKDNFVCDFRFIIAYTVTEGFKFISMFSRKSMKSFDCAFEDVIRCPKEVLTTNLTSLPDVYTETCYYHPKILQMNDENVDLTNLTLNDLVEFYVQAVLATIACDKNAIELRGKYGDYINERIMKGDYDWTFEN